MARKALWDEQTLVEEFRDARNGLQALPASHLKRLVRLLHLYEQVERWTLLEKLNAKHVPEYVHGYSQGVVTTVAALRVTMQSILDGTFEDDDGEEGEHAGPYEPGDWDERFGE